MDPNPINAPITLLELIRRKSNNCALVEKHDTINAKCPKLVTLKITQQY